MTNWKRYKITEKQLTLASSCIIFNLDDDIFYAEGGSSPRVDHIFCVNNYPFDTCEVGDYLEVDLDKTINYISRHPFNDTNIVRKVNSSEVIRGQSIAERLIREVNSQAPGKVEFEHRIEHRDGSPERFIYRRNY